MEYLHHASVPATKSELDLFHVPPTQTVIDSYYEVEYRPNASLESSKSYNIEIPESNDFTDLGESLLFVSCSVKKSDGKDASPDDVVPVHGFAHALFDQFDLYLNNVNVCQASSLYHYSAFLEDLLYSHESKLSMSKLMDGANDEKSKFDLLFRLSSPLSGQNKLLLNGIKLTIRLNRSNPARGLKHKPSKSGDFTIKIHDISAIIRRVRLYPDVSLAIQKGLEKADARYFVTRNEVKSFVVPQGLTSYSFENVFTGILPKRIILGFLKADSFNSSLAQGPFKFDNFSLNYLVAHVNGVLVPSIPYTPDYTNDKYIREFYGLYKYTNQAEGIPPMTISYKAFKTDYCLYAFDLSPDCSLGAESGVLSLTQAGNIKIEAKFSSSLSSPIHMIIMGQYDNVIQIDKYRDIKLDF